MGNEQGGQQKQMAVKNDAFRPGGFDDMAGSLDEMAVRRGDGEFAGQMVKRKGAIKDSLLNERMAAVMWLTTPTAYGSGFYCKYDGYQCVMTNNHVIPNNLVAVKTQCYFDYEEGRSRQVKVELDPDTFFRTSEELDFSIVKVKDGRSCKRPPITLRDNSIKNKKKVVIIQHPSGGRKQIDSGLVVDQDYTDLFYHADTLPGSSGSPVLDAHGDLVGLHKAGSPQKAANQATLIGAILRAL